MIAMWLSLAVPPGLMIGALLMGRLESALPAPRPTPGQAEEQLSAQPATTRVAQPAPARTARVQRTPAARPAEPRRVAAEPAARVARVQPVRAA